MRQSPILRVIYTTTSDLEASGTVDARESSPKTRRSWSAANAARRRNGRRFAIRMLAMRVAGCRETEIAEAFGTTLAAVSQRLYRLRRGGGGCRCALPRHSRTELPLLFKS